MSPRPKSRQRTPPQSPQKARAKSRSRSRSASDKAVASAAADPSPISVPADVVPHSATDDIGRWVSMDLAQHQAAGRVAHELELKERFESASTRYSAKLSLQSEQLVVNQLRSTTLALPLPSPPTPPLSDKEWVRSANFVFETLAMYEFADEDIMEAMVQTRGLGGITEVLARLCVHVPADRMPHDMRDKIELGDCRVTDVRPPASVAAASDTALDTPEGSEPADAAVEPATADDKSATAIDQADCNRDADMLSQLLDKVRLEDFDIEYAYDSDEDPGTVCGRRLVRLRALEETLDFVRHNDRTDMADTVTQLIVQEKGDIEKLEDDYIYDADQARDEYERLWPEYYDALLDDMQRIRSSAAAEAAAAAMAAENTPMPADPDTLSQGTFDGSDDDCGFGLMFASDDESTPPAGCPEDASVSPQRRVLSTSPPHGWTGAPIREMVDQLVHHYDKQASVHFQTSKCHPGTTCTFVVVWSTPAKAARILATQRSLAVTPPAEFSTCLLEHRWMLPADLAGHSAKDAKDLGALLFLFMQPAISQQLSSRLSPVLRSLWSEWECANRDSSRALRDQLLSGRIEFLRELHAQYQQEVAGDDDVEDADGDQAGEEECGLGRVERKRQRLAHAACSKRKRLWTGDTIARRQNCATWKSQFGVAQARLPVHQHRAAIVDAVAKNRVVIVRGSTGSGKSSQVPQYVLRMLLSSRYTGGRVLCTQPRRISAMSIATRVSQELGDAHVGEKSLVGFQIRHNAKCSDDNALVFCTTGVLLRKLIDDPMLSDIKCVICDEVQERTLDLDYLLIVLRRLLARRKDLRLVLMSATIDVALFAQYFDDSAVIDIPGRTFSVRNIFLESVVQLSEYTLNAESRYAVRDREGPAGPAPQLGGFNRELAADDPEYVSPLAASVVERMRVDVVNLDLIHHLVRGICLSHSNSPFLSPWVQYCCGHAPQGSILVFLPGIFEIRRLTPMLQSDPYITAVASVIPLHSSFANDRPPNSPMTYTELAFAPPYGSLVRKVVLCTNVAETGITIPDVTIVIDCGLSNQSFWDQQRRVQRLQTRLVSKANVLQRRGRAGRVQEGLSLCLFTARQFHQMVDYEQPEMHRLPLTKTCLLAKAHGAGDIMRFMEMAVDPPRQSAVKQAITELQHAGALDEKEELTPIGRHLCHLPVDLSVGKLLIVGTLFGCLGPILTVAASLSLTAPLLQAPLDELSQELARNAHEKFRRQSTNMSHAMGMAPHESDFLTALAVHDAWKRAATQRDAGRKELASFCKANWLNRDALEQLEDLREQYMRLLHELGLAQYKLAHGGQHVSLSKLLRPRGARDSGFPDGFVQPPATANENARSLGILHAAIVATMDHVIMPSTAVHGDHVIGQASVWHRLEGIGHALMLIDREKVTARPIDLDTLSVVHRAPARHTPFITRGLVAASLSSTTSGSTVRASMLTTTSLATLVVFARTLEYWPKARLLVVNRWIRCQCYAKTAAVLMAMREKLQAIINHCVASPADSLPAELGAWRQAILAVFSNDSY
ncbi:hypothetical protein LPJ61_001360 [Coemansia biformis]|uniref:P-loop containing nucleoside triphosphate hydrolase protein n=1 Tax=Coemansia biformis TaxID=1286918 RepID=A0A9W7YG48_9FUNG|nr:hypothetical protein LPJ61_001360 [Coemansia biformis]